MSTLDVSIETLPAMTVASVHAFGEAPELAAWEQLRSWAEPMGLLDYPDLHPVFGFNNPSPSPGGTEYGYEFWIPLQAGQKPPSHITIKEFPGGLYAVTRCRLLGEPNVQQTWGMLWEWVQSSEYRWRETHELEMVLNPGAPMEEMELDLYLPIEKSGAQHLRA
jgi:DNA gyrase inhibitor GyrI